MTPDASSTAGPRFERKVIGSSGSFVSPADLRREPEQYVARHAHTLGGFSFHLYR